MTNYLSIVGLIHDQNNEDEINNGIKKIVELKINWHGEMNNPSEVYLCLVDSENEINENIRKKIKKSDYEKLVLCRKQNDDVIIYENPIIWGYFGGCYLNNNSISDDESDILLHKLNKINIKIKEKKVCCDIMYSLTKDDLYEDKWFIGLKI